MSSVEEKVFEKENAIIHDEDINSETAEIAALNSIEDTQTSKVVWLIAVCVSVGGFLFGISPHNYNQSYANS